MIRRIPLNRRTGLMAGGALLCLTATAAVVGNASIEHRVESRVAAAADCRIQPSGNVTASLDGTFAGLEALSGKADSVTVHASDVNRHGVDVDVDATLHDVKNNGTTQGGTATVTASYDKLTQYFNGKSNARDVTVGSDGTGLAFSTTTKQGVPVTIHATLKTTDDSLSVTPTDITLLGRTVPVDTVSRFSGSSGIADRLEPKTVKFKIGRAHV